MKENWTFKISLLVILNLLMGLTSKFGINSSQPGLILQKKQVCLQYWKTQKNSHEMFNFNYLQIGKIGQTFGAKVDIPCYYNTYINYFRGRNYCCLLKM